MSTVTSALVPCEDIQGMLNDHFSTCNLGRRPAPFLNFLMSPLNASNIARVVHPGENKVRTVNLVYEQRILLSEVQDINDTARSCTATTKRGNLSTSYTIDPAVKKRSEELIDPVDWADICQGNQERFAARLQANIDVVMDAVAENTASQLAALPGPWSTDATAVSDLTFDANDNLVVKTKKDSSTDPMPYTLQDVQLATQLTNYCTGVAGFGGTDFYRYVDLIESGCCANDGLDFASLLARYGFSTSYDRWVADVFGNDVTVLTQPGALQLLYYSRNDDGLSGPTFGANYYKTVIFDPITGIPLDLTISDNCGQISIIVDAVTELVGMPADMFGVGDEMEGVNFVNTVKVTNV